ncbi:MAG: LamG domain-containing protein, partial [Verrucomicrobiota bacterium]
MKTKNILKLALAAALCVGSYESQAQITNGLVVHLTFDGKNPAGNYSNSVPNTVEGIPVGTPTTAVGKIGSSVALTVDGPNSINNYVTLGYPAELQFGAVADNSATDFSIAFWVNYTNQASDPVFIGSQNWNSSQNPGWGIYMQGGGNFRVVTKDDSGDATHRQSITPSSILRDGTWHHLAVTWGRRSSVSIYRDGVLIATSPDSQTTGLIDTGSNLGQSVNIGQDGTGVYQQNIFNMQNLLMDDLGIWRRELSGGEVSAIYNSGLGGTNISKVPTIVNPFVKSTTPALQADGVNPATPIAVVITDGAKALDNTSVTLTLNGATVPTTITKAGVDSTVSYIPPTILPAGLNTATIVFANSGTPKVFVTNTWTFTVAPYTSLAPNLKVTADTSKPGFKWNIFANQANTVSSNARAEAALAGALTDVDGITPLPNNANPAAQGAAIAPASPASPATAPLKFEIAGVLNLDSAAGSLGNFQPDAQMPGLPALDGSSDGAAAEAITYISLPAGLVTMGINSDDGFRTAVGLVPQDVIGGLRVGEFDGARGNSDSIFYLSVQEAGVYAFRTTWQNGTGAANIEWFTMNGTNKVLVNDVANGGRPAYRALTTPIPPYIKYVSPEPVQRVLNQPVHTLKVILSDGTTALNDSSIVLKLDGTVIAPTKTRSGSLVTLTYTPTTLQFPGDQHLAELTFSNVGGTFTTTERWSFFNLLNVVLPTPVLTENFESTAEGSVPTGWMAINFTDCSGGFCATPGLDLDNLNSDSYKGWIVVDGARLSGLKSRIFNVAPGQTKNGVDVTIDDLTTGKLLYAESDVRDDDQVQFLKTAPFNLSTVTNPALSFGSLYEQNQDSIGAVEYSVDGGINWLPVVYYIDQADSGGDIRLKTDTTVDAIATFTAAQGDAATWIDAGVSKGGNYGDAIAAPITQALGRYVYPRVNDDRTI